MTTGLLEIVSQILFVIDQRGNYDLRHKVMDAVKSEFYSDYPGQLCPCSLNEMVDLLDRSGIIVRDNYGVYSLPDQKPFGFHLNKSTTRPERKIVHSSVTGETGSGPATTIHQFYSVEQAKELVHQLLIAIAQAEGDSTDELSE